jgi:hypothetical protein
MSQRHVELLIGRLLTDEELREEFTRAPFETLAAFCRRGWELSRGEIDAFTQTDVAFWTFAAGQLPSRLRRSSLRSHAVSPRHDQGHQGQPEH